MDSRVAFTIIGCVLAFVIIMFNLIPKQINQKLMWDLTEEVSQVADGFIRVILGSIEITFGIVALSWRNFPVVEDQTLIYALGAGFYVITAIFVSVKIRSFGVFPIPPTIIFAILAIIAFYTAYGLVLE